MSPGSVCPRGSRESDYVSIAFRQIMMDQPLALVQRNCG